MTRLQSPTQGLTDAMVSHWSNVGRRPAPAKAPTSIRLTSAFDYDVKDPRDFDYSALPPDEAMELRGKRDAAQLASRLYWSMVDAAGPQGPQDPQNAEDLAGSILYGSATAVLSDPKAAPEAKRQAQETLRLHEQRVGQKRAAAEKGLAETHQAPADVYARILAMRKQGLTDLEIDRTLESGGWDVRKVGAQRIRKIDEHARILEETGDFSGAKRLRLGKLDIIRNGGGAIEFGPEDLRLAQIRQAEQMPQTTPEAFSSAVLDAANQTVGAIQRYAGTRPDETDGALARIFGSLPDRDVIAAQGRGASKSAPVTAFGGNLAGGFIDPVLGILNFIPFSLPARAATRGRYLSQLVGRGVSPQIAAAAAEKLTMEGVAREAAKQWFIKKGISNPARAEVFAGLLVNATQNAVFGAGIGAFQAGSYEGATAGDVVGAGILGAAEGAAFGVAFEGAFRGLRSVSEILGGTVDGQSQKMLDRMVADPALSTLAPKLGEFTVRAREAARLKGGKLDAAEAEEIAQGLGFSLAEPQVEGAIDAGQGSGPLAGGAGGDGEGAGEPGRLDRPADVEPSLEEIEAEVGSVLDQEAARKKAAEVEAAYRVKKLEQDAAQATGKQLRELDEYEAEMRRRYDELEEAGRAARMKEAEAGDQRLRDLEDNQRSIDEWDTYGYVKGKAGDVMPREPKDKDRATALRGGYVRGVEEAAGIRAPKEPEVKGAGTARRAAREAEEARKRAEKNLPESVNTEEAGRNTEKERVWWHGSHLDFETPRASGNKPPDRRSRGFDGAGVWLTSDEPAARMYGPKTSAWRAEPKKVLELAGNGSRPWDLLADPAVLSDFLTSDELDQVVNHGPKRKAILDRLHNVNPVGLKDGKTSINSDGKTYPEAIFAKLKAEGYDAVRWSGTRLDLPSDRSEPHDVMVVFDSVPVSRDIGPASAPEAEAQAAQQAEAARADETPAAGESAGAGVLVPDRAADEGGPAGAPGETRLGVEEERRGVERAGGDKDVGAGEHGGKSSVQTVESSALSKADNLRIRIKQAKEHLIKAQNQGQAAPTLEAINRRIGELEAELEKAEGYKYATSLEKEKLRAAELDQEAERIEGQVSGILTNPRKVSGKAYRAAMDEAQRLKDVANKKRREALKIRLEVRRLEDAEKVGTVSPKLAADDPRRPGESDEDFAIRVKHRGAEEDTAALEFGAKGAEIVPAGTVTIEGKTYSAPALKKHLSEKFGVGVEVGFEPSGVVRMDFQLAQSGHKVGAYLRKRGFEIIQAQAPESIGARLLARAKAPEAPKKYLEVSSAKEPVVGAWRSQKKGMEAKHPGAILLMKNGDSYVTFDADAETLAGMGVGFADKRGDGIPQTSIPPQKLEASLKKIIAAGHRVAVSEKVADGVSRIVDQPKAPAKTKEVTDGAVERTDEAGGAGAVERGAGEPEGDKPARSRLTPISERPAEWTKDDDASYDARIKQLWSASERKRPDVAKLIEDDLQELKRRVPRLRGLLRDARELLASDEPWAARVERGRVIVHELDSIPDPGRKMGSLLEYFVDESAESTLRWHFQGERLLPDIEAIDTRDPAARQKLTNAHEAFKKAEAARIEKGGKGANNLAGVALSKIGEAHANKDAKPFTIDDHMAAGGKNTIPEDTRIYITGEDTPAHRKELAKIVDKMAEIPAILPRQTRAVPAVAKPSGRYLPPTAPPSFRGRAEIAKWLESATRDRNPRSAHAEIDETGRSMVSDGRIAYIETDPQSAASVLVGKDPGAYSWFGTNLERSDAKPGMLTWALEQSFGEPRINTTFAELRRLTRSAKGAGADAVVLTRNKRGDLGAVAFVSEGGGATLEFGQLLDAEPAVAVNPAYLADAIEYLMRTVPEASAVERRTIMDAPVEIEISALRKGQDDEARIVRLRRGGSQILIGGLTGSPQKLASRVIDIPTAKPSGSGGGGGHALAPPPRGSRGAPSRKAARGSGSGDEPEPFVPPAKGPDSIPLPPGRPMSWGPEIEPKAGPAHSTMAELPNVRPTPMPEMIALAEMWMGSRPFLARLRGNKGGDFMPMGKGQIRMTVKNAANAADLARTLSHEIGHLIDYLPDHMMQRGNVLGRVLGTAQKWLHGDAKRLIERIEFDGATHLEYGPEITEATNKQLREELDALTKWWHPYDEDAVPDSYKRYRKSAVELFAEGLSVFLVSPGELKDRAPLFYNELLIHLNRKPQVLDGLLTIQRMLAGEPGELAEARRARAETGYLKAEDQIRQAERERLDAEQPITSYIGQVLLDIAGPVIAKEKEVYRRGIRPNAEKSARVALEELGFANNEVKLWLDQVEERVDAPLKAAGISRDDAGWYMQNVRIAEGDRGNILDDDGVLVRGSLANPQGLTPADAEFHLAELKKKMGPEKFAQLERHIQTLRDLVYDVNQKAMEAGVYSRKAFDETITPNKDTYAPFAVVDYITDYMPAGIKQQIGTFKDIANPYLTLTMKTMSVIRATELNKAKTAVMVDLLGTHFPGEITFHRPPRYPGAPRPQPPRPAHGKEILPYYEDGHIVYAEVDRYIERVFMHHDIGMLQRLGRMTSLMTYPVFHPLYVSWSVGWQVKNIARDIWRSYKNLGGLGKAAPTMAEVLGAYLRALPPSIRRAANIRDATITKMLQEKALDIPFTQRMDPTDDTAAYDRILARHGMGDLHKKRYHKLIGPLERVLDFVAQAGTVTETVPKLATYQMLGRRGIDGKRRAYFVRNYVGTPNTRRRGAATTASNGLFMYSNVVLQGVRADAELGLSRDPLFPSSASGVWTRLMLTQVMPKLVMRGAAAGLFGAGVAAWFDMIPESDKQNYIILPFPPFTVTDEETKTVKAVYMRVPHDDTSRMLLAPLWHASKGEAGRALATAFGELPGLSTPVDLTLKWTEFAAGRNPYDAFRGREIIDRDAFEAGGWDAVKEMGRYTAGEFGAVSDILRGVISPSGDLTPRTRTERVLSAIPGLSAIIRVSDRGMREKQWSDVDLEDVERARFRLSLPENVRPLLSQRYSLHRFKASSALSPQQVQRLSVLDGWYRLTYRPLTDRIKRAMDQKNAADEAAARKQLEADTARISAR